MGKQKREGPIMRIKFASQKGAAAVEFALVLPLLVVITFGIIEFGMLMYNQQVLTNASREGARAGIVVRTPNPRLPATGANSIESVVQNYCLNNLVTFGATNIPPTTTVTYPSQNFGDPLTVQVNYTYSFLVIPNFIPGITSPRTMKAITVMKYE
jgi:Flp pilus assembly protein TadG